MDNIDMVRGETWARAYEECEATTALMFLFRSQATNLYLQGHESHVFHKHWIQLKIINY